MLVAEPGLHFSKTLAPWTASAAVAAEATAAAVVIVVASRLAGGAGNPRQNVRKPVTHSAPAYPSPVRFLSLHRLQS